MKSFLSLILLLVYTADGANIYVAQVSTGNGSGSDASDCKSIASVNSSWPASAGDTVHLVGTLTNELTVGGSGSAGSPITIYFEPNAKFSAPCWPQLIEDGGAITLFGINFITIDGGSNGLIEATANGSGLAFQTNCIGVGGLAANHLVVKNLTIRNMYVRTNMADVVPGLSTQCGIRDSSSGSVPGLSDVVVTNCVISDASTGIYTDYGVGSSNYTIIGNTISNVNWGGSAGDISSSATLLNLVLANNSISGFSNWNNPTNNGYHHNGFIAFANSGYIQSFTAYGNKVGPGWGGGFQTSGIFVQGGMSNVLIYNNVFIANTNETWADGMIFLRQLFGTTANFSIFNNTFIGGGLGTAISLEGPVQPVDINNNLAVSVSTAISFFDLTNSYTINNNFAFNLNPSQQYNYSTTGTALFKTFSQWQSLGYDLDGSASIDPQLNSIGQIQSGNSAFGTGTNLSSFFTTDFTGATRPATGNWTIGAFESPGTNIIIIPYFGFAPIMPLH